MHQTSLCGVVGITPDCNCKVVIRWSPVRLRSEGVPLLFLALSCTNETRRNLFYDRHVVILYPDVRNQMFAAKFRPRPSGVEAEELPMSLASRHAVSSTSGYVHVAADNAGGKKSLLDPITVSPGYWSVT
jgi:hypothetical protein